MVLGDGYLSKNRKNSHLKIEHSVKQKDYFDLKVDVLKTLTSVNIFPTFSHIDGKDFPQWVCETKSHPIYTELRDRFYYHGRKTVDSHLMKLLSEEGLAYWYLDDGYSYGEKTRQTAYLCTECFNKAEQELMNYWLVKRFGLHFRPNKSRNSYRLRLLVKDTDKLVDIVKPYTPKNMLYKIDFDRVCKGTALYTCSYCGKKFYDGIGKNRKYCSNKCAQKVLWKTGRSNLYQNYKLRRYSPNSIAI